MASNAASEPVLQSNHQAGEGKTPGSSLMSRMAINDNKAGMEGLDKEKVNQIIYEASKGSKFYENERKKEQQLDLRLQKFKSYADQISAQKLQEGKVQADLLLEKLKLERDLSHTIVHMDMDAFYAAVEMKDDPSLNSKPMAVGGMDMLSTSNYLARKFGVRAGMPGFIGLKLCPSLIIVKQNFDKYKAVSHEVRKILSLYDPNFCPMSLDEAYLDFGQHLENRHISLISERTFVLRSTSKFEKSKESTDICHCDLNNVLLPSILNSDVFLALINDEVEFESYINNFNSENANEGIPTICPACNKKLPAYKLKVYGRSVEDAVLEMRNRIEQNTQLTASAGIAPNMMLAKICSDKNKPNGQYRIMPDIAQIETFVEDLPIRKVSGIGKVTEKLLGGLDVIKCSDIYIKRSLLYHLFSPTSFNHFLCISLGIGSTTVERDDERKSISTEETFSEISDVAELCNKCEEICESVCTDMKQDNIKGKTVTLKLKTISFEVVTRSQTLPELTSDPAVVFNAAKKLLLTEVRNTHPAPLRLRLMGVRLSKLVSTSTNNDQVTVSSMFNKYKEKEGTSSKSHDQINTDSDSFTLTDRDGADSFTLGEGEVDEDFSRPFSDTNDSKKNSKMGTVSPSKTKNVIKKNDASSGNILGFFARQKDIQVRQNNQCNNETPKISTEETLQPVQNDNNKNKKLTQKTSVNSSNESLGEKNDVCVIDDDNDIATTSSNSDASLTCPICALRLSGWDLQAINSHIDSCLNRQTIRNILQDEKVEVHSPSQSCKSKRPRSGSSNQETRNPGKVRKIQSSVLSYFQP